MKTLGSPKKVFVNFADNAMLSILKECDYRQLTAEVTKGATDKNPVLRQHSFHYMQIGLKKYDAEVLEKEEQYGLEKMIAAIKEGVADSKSEVRQNASSCVGIIQTKFPHHYETLIASLDPTSLKQLTAVLKKKAKPAEGEAAPTTRPSTFVRPSIAINKPKFSLDQVEIASEEKVAPASTTEEKAAPAPAVVVEEKSE